MNAIVIEQTQDDAKLAFEVHQNAAIQRIRLARARVASQAIDEAPRATVSVKFTFKSKALTAPPNILRLEIAFRMAGVEEPSQEDVDAERPESLKSEPVVLVECAYEVDYLLRESFAISAEHKKAFKDGNGIFNIWPYFREYLQSNLQRMGLPPLVAPFLRLQPKPGPRQRRKAEREVPKGLQ